jgi:signal transduction histidine kinase
VRQVLYNLLSNAIGFSKPGDSVSVSVWREAGMMAFAVQDRGVGIPKEEQGRVFERFESRSQGSKHRGAGLGLSIVKSLVELHGGVMALESEPGRGTRVTVRFPEDGIAASAPASAEPAPAQA